MFPEQHMPHLSNKKLLKRLHPQLLSQAHLLQQELQEREYLPVPSPRKQLKNQEFLLMELLEAAQLAVF
jgi:hypothetical protein